MKYGFARVAAASPEIRVADCEFNTRNIIKLIRDAQNESAEFLVFPELCITGYSCGDLFRHQTLLTAAKNSLIKIVDVSSEISAVIIVGLPLTVKGSLYNCAAVIQNGRILGIVPKTISAGNIELRCFTEADELETTEIYISGYKVPIGKDLIFIAKDDDNVSFGVEIGQEAFGPLPPSSFLARAGSLLIFNLSASNELVGKAYYRRSLIQSLSARCIAGYVLASSNCGESTTDHVYGGHMIIAEKGKILTESDRFYFDNKIIMADVDLDRLKHNRFAMGRTFEEKKSGPWRDVYFDWSKEEIPQGRLLRNIGRHPFIPEDDAIKNDRCNEIISIQTMGLAKRLKHTGVEKLVLGISGGLDSTYAFIVVARVMEQLNLPKSNIIAVTMPGFGTTGRTYENSVNLTRNLGATFKEVNIKDACLQHFKDIGHDKDVLDVTYENVQARERTQILMDLANKVGALVIGTGDLSELALGWCTYNGDHMSMYSVNGGVPKTLIPHIIKWYADHEADEETKRILYDIIDTPISPELLPPSGTGEILQKTEEILGPYEVHDFFLYNMLRGGAGPKKILFIAKTAFPEYTETQLKNWLTVFYKRFFSQQFKRSCLPDGPSVGTVNLSPRGEWNMPSDASVNLWLSELEGL